MFAAEHGVVVTAEFVWGFGLDNWNLLTASVLIDGDEDEVGAGDVEVGPGLRVFDPDLNTNFNRCVESAVNAGLEDEEIADVHGLDEINVIHGRGDDVSAGVAICRDRADDVDEVHEAAAEEVPKGVGIVGENDLSHLGLSAGNGADGRVGVSRAHV